LTLITVRTIYFIDTKLICSIAKSPNIVLPKNLQYQFFLISTIILIKLKHIYQRSRIERIVGLSPIYQ